MAREGGSYVINASGQPVLRERTDAPRPKPKPKPQKPAAKEEADRDADT